MFLFLRGFCLLFPGVFLATMLSAQAADNQTNSVAPPVAVPAFLDVVSFEFQVDGENHKAIVTMGPTLVRVDEKTITASSIIRKPTTIRDWNMEITPTGNFPGPKSVRRSKTPSVMKRVFRN